MKKIAIVNTESRKIPERPGFEREDIERNGELLVGSVFYRYCCNRLFKKI